MNILDWLGRLLVKMRIGKKLRPSGSGGSTPAPVADTTPNAFTFTDVAAVAVSTVQTSNSVTPTGYDTPSAISVTGGEYELDNTGVWGNTAGLISPGSSVRVRHTASASGGTATNTVLTIGGVSDTFTSTTLSATVTAPTLTQTSSAGASPFLFDASLNTSDTYAGYIFRVQTASGTGGDFTVTTQDISHILSESDITSGDIDISTDGFLTPSGGFSLRARIERDDGVTSAWSNTLTDTISASVAQWSSTNGTKKSTWITVSGGNLVARGTIALGAYAGVAASIAGATKAQFEITLTANNTEVTNRLIGFGLYNAAGATDFSGLNIRPGISDSNGLIISTAIGITSVDLFRNSGVNNTTWTAPSVNAVGDIFTLKVDSSGAGGTHSITVYRNRSGTEVTIGTVGSLTLTNFTTAFVVMQSDEILTANFGGSTFAHALDSGYSIYA